MTKPTQVARIVERCIANQWPAFIKGPVGAGKSQVVNQATDKLNHELVDIRLSQMDPTDIKGFPAPDMAKGVMRWLRADFLPDPKTKSKGTLFFDELPSAPLAVQAACYQLFLDRRVGSYKLPDGWSMLAAGNRDVDRSIVNKMPAALNNRLIHIDFEVDLEDWVAHAMASGVSAETIAFLRFRSNLLHHFDAASNPPAFPSPRTWFRVDEIVKDKMPQEDEYALIQGTVGAPAAAEFAAFMRVISELPTVDEIKLTPDTTIIPESPATLYALTTTLSMATTKSGFARFMQYVERMETEWQVVYIRDCLKRENTIKHDPVFTKWSIANADVVL